MMKAAYIETTGPATNIRYGDLPDPVPTADQVLVKVGAVSLNPVDTYLRAGVDWWELPFPFVIGCDVAGEVVAVGDQVENLQVGDRVWGTNQGLLGRQGTFAEYCAIDPRWLYRTPENVTDEEAAACSLVGITAHLGLFGRAKLQPGERVFAQGGAGGVGSMVVQMAKIAGAQVIATAGSEDRVSHCLALGADRAVNYHQEDVAKQVSEFAPDGIDVYWETCREPDLESAVTWLAEKGRIILMAGREAAPPLPVGPFYVKGCSLHGFVMFKATDHEQRIGAEEINQWMAEGKLQARIDRVLPLAEAAAAHQLQEENTLGNSGTLSGKIVLKP